MAHPQLQPPVTPPHPHTASSTSSMLSPPHNMPLKLSWFLSYTETHLGIKNTCLHEDSLHTLGFGPDILHLVEDNVLKDIEFIPGDMIHLKQSMWQWWSTNAKSKWVSHMTSPLAQSTPPNKRVRFEKWFHDGGCYMVYGPKMVEGESSLDTTVTTDFDWYYLCTARDAMVPLPFGYVPIINGEHIDEGAIWLAIISYRLVYMRYMFLVIAPLQLHVLPISVPSGRA